MFSRKSRPAALKGVRAGGGRKAADAQPVSEDSFFISPLRERLTDEQIKRGWRKARV